MNIMTPPHESALQVIGSFAGEIRSKLGEAALRLDTPENRVFEAYCVGAIIVLAQEKALTIEDCFALAAEASRRFFGRSPEECVRVGKALIQGSVDRASPNRPIAERGIGGFSSWRSNR